MLVLRNYDEYKQTLWRVVLPVKRELKEAKKTVENAKLEADRLHEEYMLAKRPLNRKRWKEANEAQRKAEAVAAGLEKKLATLSTQYDENNVAFLERSGAAS